MGDKYMWNPRAEILKFNMENEIPIATLEKTIKKNKLNSKETWEKYISANPDLKIKFTSETIEQNDSNSTDKMLWETGLYSNNDKQIYQVIKVLPKQRKDLSEVRGFAVAAYQEQLEKEWLNHLHKTYAVKINETVLDKLIK